MKGCVFCNIIIFAFFVLCPLQVFCITNDSDNSTIIDEQYDETGAYKLESSLPNGVFDSLKKSGVNSPKPDDMQNFSIGGFFNGLFSQMVDVIKTPFSILAGCFAILLFCALFEGLKTTTSLALDGVLGIVTAVCTCGIIITPIIGCVNIVSGTIRNFGNFMLCFIPVFTGVIATSGGTLSSIGYNTALFSLSQIISSVIADILLPFMGVFLAFSIAGSISGQFKISGLTSAVKKTVIFTLSLLITLFVGLFSVQSMVAASTDGLSMKTAKFISSSFVPVVGSALSEALSSVMGCLGLIKTSIGCFGILACILTFVPPILTVIFFLISISFAGGFAEAMGIPSMSAMMTAVKDCLSVLLSFLICYGILIIITTSIMIKIGAG
ncbi:MAG: stage III sporulation protein AE [Oscillospiraceae bacterium]|nr:stage III sporulation protein AE [Oscillospiraceae bacterium]